jgi:transcriptional regulator with XRE-family HTH domain
MLDDHVQDLLAANLRRLRIARHLSLSELARGTGISKATLSSIENARANPTVTTLSALADALRVPLTELLEELPIGEVRVVRAARSAVEPGNGIPRREIDEIETLAVSEISLAAGRTHEAEPGPAGSRAHVYVIAGKLIAGPVERVTELGPGDYASFPADVPHVYEARRHPARALLLAAGPS